MIGLVSVRMPVRRRGGKPEWRLRRLIWRDAGTRIAACNASAARIRLRGPRQVRRIRGHCGSRANILIANLECVMRIAKLALRVIGVLAILVGVVWIGQGTGYFPYPASSFMINEMPWAWRGIATAVAGLIALAVARRI
jgi:hypothetical protein